MNTGSSAGVAAPGSGEIRAYAGDVDAGQAWNILENEPEAVLVDVRTRAEWNYVGLPDLGKLGKKVILVEWQNFPDMARNPSFVEEVMATGIESDAPVLFLCRSGQRSAAAAAAMTREGFSRCYNISGGFEGPPDASRHRGAVDGWKARGLPWIQG